MTGHDERAAFHHVLDDGDVENPVECIDGALNAAAAREVDDGILRHVEEIARDHDIRSAEVDDAVAIGVRRLGVRDNHAFAVDEVQLLLVAEVGLARNQVLLARPSSTAASCSRARRRTRQALSCRYS